jgi:hypothetical protein
MAQQSVGIEQSVDDQVVLPACVSEKGAGIVHDCINPKITVGLFRVVQLTRTKNCRVDLNCVYVLGSRAQSGRDIVAGARATIATVLGPGWMR